MTAHMPIAPDGRGSRAVLRIALPAWGYGRKAPTPNLEPKRTSREEFQRLLDGALGPHDLGPLKFTKAERRQLAISRRVRKALYELPFEA